MNETAQAPESVVQTRLRMIQDVWDRFMSWAAALSTFDREYFEALGRDAKEYESPPFICSRAPAGTRSASRPTGSSGGTRPLHVAW